MLAAVIRAAGLRLAGSWLLFPDG